MPASSREEELRRGQRGEADSPGDPAAGGASAPGLTVYVVTQTSYDETTVVGVASSAEKGRELADRDWHEASHRSAELLWDEYGSYYFMGEKRRNAGYEVDSFVVA